MSDSFLKKKSIHHLNAESPGAAGTAPPAAASAGGTHHRSSANTQGPGDHGGGGAERQAWRLFKTHSAHAHCVPATGMLVGKSLRIPKDSPHH